MGVTLAAAAAAGRAEASSPVPAASHPNIVLYLADQWRWDFTGANGLNGSSRTPNLDAMVARGTNFNHTVTNQPVCGPSRSVLFSSRYATDSGVWRNGLPLRHDIPTLAGELRKAGYSANLIGKWHLAAGTEKAGGGPGFVKAEDRGGFLDLWEGANALEHTTHPYEGTIWDRDGKEITYKDEYRVDFLTDRAEHFLRSPAAKEKPFFLFISQLEPHQQNDMGQPIGPHGSVDRYKNSHVPPDLRALPGTWQAQLPDYYGCVEAIDTSVGRVRKILQDEQLADNTLFVFMSDHGCHFMTRNAEYKRSTHNASLRVPLIFDGPGFDHGRTITQLAGIIDIAPTLLAAAGLQAPADWKGRSLLPLVASPDAREGWADEQYVQISESMTGRSVRTRDWTYCVADLSGDTTKPAAASYHEYQMYDQRNDPAELVNLAGRADYRKQADALREVLLKHMAAAGETADIVPAKLYP
jgi:arylsulfatase A-like enzyme